MKYANKIQIKLVAYFIIVSMMLTMIEPAFALSVEIKKKHATNSKICGDKLCNEKSTFLERYRKKFPTYQGSGLNLISDTISGEPYLIFDGYGWYGFHNVAILISNGHWESELITKTNHHGHLHLPWKIPDSNTTGLFHIRATDGIHEYNTDYQLQADHKP